MSAGCLMCDCNDGYYLAKLDRWAWTLRRCLHSCHDGPVVRASGLLGKERTE